jgi:hypothetical protein
MKSRCWRAMGVLAGLAVQSGCLRTGPLQTEEIRIGRPRDASLWKLHFQIDTADAVVDSEDGDLVSGAVTYNVATLRPVVESRLGETRVRQRALGTLPRDARNEWRLHLGRGVPLDVSVMTGQSQLTWDLSGASIRGLSWTQGGGRAALAFDTPNPVEMEGFAINVGAAALSIRGLANARLKEGRIVAGVGDVSLTCDGRLERESTIVLVADLASVTIRSGGNAVRVTSTGPVKTEAERWSRDGQTYCSPECASASGPKLTIVVLPGIGVVHLKTGI